METQGAIFTKFGVETAETQTAAKFTRFGEETVETQTATLGQYSYHMNTQISPGKRE